MNVVKKVQPTVLHSFWKNKDGKVALILANYTKEKQSFSYNKLGVSNQGPIEGLSYLKIEL